MTTQLAPYHLVQQPHGVLLELISYPYEDDHGRPVVKARSPGDPTTMATHDIGNLEPVVAECHCERNRWDAVVTGEFKDCHLTCPRCNRNYFAVHDDSGKFLWFECPVFRRDPPAH